MLPRPALRSHPRTRSVLAALLLLLIVLAVPVEVSQPIHRHDAGTVGLYNEEHVLASLDSVVGDVPLPDCRLAVFIALVAEARVTAAGARLSAPALDLPDSRAPPPA